MEAEDELVRLAEELCQQHGADVEFATGSFIPNEFSWQLDEGDEAHRTRADVAAAYDQLDMELRDFDLVYAYPWPDEHTLFRNIMRQCGGEHAILLSYDVREGIQLTRCGQ